MIIEKYKATEPDINNENIIHVYNKTNISDKEQFIINDIIKLFDMNNECLVYTYMVKNNIEYIIYKGKKSPTQFELKHSGLNNDELIYIDIIYQSNLKTLRIDISIRNKITNHLILYNSKDYNITELTITQILLYYNGTIESLKRTRNYDPLRKDND